MFKTTLLALAAAIVLAPAALAQERTILSGTPSADEFAGYLFQVAPPAGVKLRGLPTRGIQMVAAAGEAAASAPAVAAAAPQAAAAPAPAAPAAPTVLAAPVNFALASAAIPTEFAPLLANLAEAMKRPEAAGKILLVSGHTDSRGDDASNLVLSERRAHAVEAFLISRGVEAKRIVAVGKGETDMLPGKASDDGQNRRVEFRIMQ